MYVYVDPTNTDHDSVRDAVIEELRKQNEFLRAELERKDTIIMSLTQRIPELEPASEPREGAVSHAEASGRGEDREAEGEPLEKSFWRRLFG